MEELEKIGVDNIKLALALPIKLGDVIAEVVDEGYQGAESLVKLSSTLPDLLDLLRVNWSALKAEFGDLAEDEIIDIKTYIFEKFSIPQGDIEFKIEKSIEIALQLANLIKSAIALFSNKPVE
jgi:hypothetical protein